MKVLWELSVPLKQGLELMHCSWNLYLAQFDSAQQAEQAEKAEKAELH
jgi:hypothetical protein